MSCLQVLNLRNNSLEGRIPNALFNLSSLRILDLSINHLTGYPWKWHKRGTGHVDCLCPTELPKFDDPVDIVMACQQEEAKCPEFKNTEEHLEFELF
ncbi:hypothetical protein IFM89_017928 [Coptis chinensis]|uniref:Uncharacterized protein n=1 Tax=Coptis chinensis TaxID=261450 RepID=A0A835HRD4_9MAGN|nr:hypothetical protein IFM89_017928 [Coptis chinensis]